MSYSQGHPIRLVGGRLALDFVNTADWTSGDEIAHEKLTNVADLEHWLRALSLEHTEPVTDLAGLIDFRYMLRQLVLKRTGNDVLNIVQSLDFSAADPGVSLPFDQSIAALIAASAVSILSDKREQERIKMCPGDNCGWLFVDETKNGRRTWCSMESCGNRAKAARHYARTRDKRA
ncbi:CGNR zinc finger domain-containing protein [uncultured Roseibium sp.]|uniref:CGNR zinc finger domain-containing protein n=1 Tax=uncultured Roseibium sp. TaxID=1936171 RepID=UPI0026148661|nr:CGNR zinc finger domain-containing protein [uncultured Roseibium sp.]